MCQDQSPFSKHCFLPGTLLLFILSTSSFPSVAFLSWMVYTLPLNCPFCHLDSCCVLIYTTKGIWNGSQILSHYNNVCKNVSIMLPDVWASFFVPLNFLLLSCHFMPTFFLMGELWSLIPSHVRLKDYCNGAFQQDTWHTLTHLLTYITFDPWRKILIAGEWSFDRLSLFFWQCQQWMADRVAPVIMPKIWNWRIIVSPSRVFVLSTAIL